MCFYFSLREHLHWVRMCVQHNITFMSYCRKCETWLNQVWRQCKSRQKYPAKPTSTASTAPSGTSAARSTVVGTGVP